MYVTGCESPVKGHLRVGLPCPSNICTLQVSYLNDLSEGQPRRRLKIWRSWQFVCTCERCRRESDCGVACESCEGGFAFPTEPNRPGTSWRCQMCDNRVPEGDIVEILLQEEVKLKCHENSQIPPKSRLHKNHFLLKDSETQMNEE